MASICGSPVCAGGKPKMKFTYTGDYVVRKDGVVELLTSGTIVFLEPKVIDVFMVGGGAGGRDFGGSSAGATACGGGGGGYTRTVRRINVSAQTPIQVAIGAGGLAGKNGSSTGFGTEYSVGGGKVSTANFLQAGAGGSGGGGGVISNTDYGAGGYDGNNGENGYGASAAIGGIGQGFTTKEFAETTGKLYAGGGGGGRYIAGGTFVISPGGAGGGGSGACGHGSDVQAAAAGVANTGGGGGGAAASYNGIIGNAGSGGSGIVCFRDAVELPELAGTWVLHKKLYVPETMPLTENVNFSSTNDGGGAASENDQCIFRTQYGVSYFEIHSTSLARTVTVYTFSTDSWANKWTRLTFPAGATASDEFRAWLAINATKQA